MELSSAEARGGSAPHFLSAKWEALLERGRPLSIHCGHSLAGLSGAMSILVLWAAALLYIFPPLWMMIRRGWPIRAGLTMVAAALLPWVEAFAFKDGPWPPGAGIAMAFTAMLLFIAVATIATVIVLALVRLHRSAKGSGATRIASSRGSSQ